MITIKNNQKKISVSEKKIKEYIKKIIKILGYENFDVGIWLTTNSTIKKYNKTYRKKNKPTDILSFPFYPDLKPEKKITPKSDDEKNLGDLIISLEYAKKDAKKFDKTLDEHLKVLLVHGICHLVGYTHETERDYKKMQAQEQYLLKKLN
ncbi:rRNA maturation RNase YbeY [Candidatus Dependentiae bacterium]